MDGSSIGSVCSSVERNVALIFAVAKWFCGKFNQIIYITLVIRQAIIMVDYLEFINPFVQ